jgi:hypothetical protein
MEWEIRLKLMVENPFFLFKIFRLKATVHTVRASINIKTGSPDPADLARTRPLIHWHIAL